MCYRYGFLWVWFLNLGGFGLGLSVIGVRVWVLLLDILVRALECGGKDRGFLWSLGWYDHGVVILKCIEEWIISIKEIFAVLLFLVEYRDLRNPLMTYFLGSEKRYSGSRQKYERSFDHVSGYCISHSRSTTRGGKENQSRCLLRDWPSLSFSRGLLNRTQPGTRIQFVKIRGKTCTMSA